MKKTLTILPLLAVFAAGSAFAEDDCFAPMADWQPKEAVAQLAEKNGWIVRRIKIDDGCYEIDGHDASGRAIEVKVQPATLHVIKIDYENESENEKEDRLKQEDDESRKKQESKASTND